MSAAPLSQRFASAIRSRSNWFFLAFMAVLTSVFVMLCLWQFDRLDQKLAIISAIEARASLPVQKLPPASEWPDTDPETISYLPVRVSGEFDHRQTVLLFAHLGQPNGKFGGPGYFVMTPFQVGEGTVFVNRGFVPQQLAENFKDGGGGPQGQIEITGLVRAPEKIGTFTPASDFSGRIEWARSAQRLAGFLKPVPENLAPFTIDADASAQGALPQGGETRMKISNRHLEYALTWLSLAIITPILVIFWFLNQLRPPKA